MQLISPPGEPDIYTFLVDGVPYQLLCDDAQHGISMIPYQATEDTLSDLDGALLERNDDPNAYQDYETIATLDIYALENPSDIEVTEDAIWSLTQNRSPRNSDAAALLEWAQSQDPANANLTNFVIFATPDHQEQTGFVTGSQIESVPEPSAWLLVLGGLSLLAWRASSFRRRSST